MKKIGLLGGILLAVFIFMGAGCGDNKVKEGGSEDFNATIQEMAKKGKPYYCVYSMNYEGGEQEGEMYFSGKDKMRGEVKMDLPQVGVVNSYFIKIGDTQYMWGDNQMSGIKMTITEEDEKRAQEQQIQQGMNMDLKIDMKCKKWTVDESKFNLPSNVQFQDLDEMLSGAMMQIPDMSAGVNNSGAGLGNDNAMGGGSMDLCEMCNQVPAGVARDACISESCN